MNFTRIVLTGPESTGKTTLASALAAHYQLPLVPEYARQFLDGLSRPYEEADLLTIAKGQWAAEEATAAQNPYIVCDTSLLVIKVWSDFKYGRCHPWIVEKWRKRSGQLYFLCGTEVPWQYDPLREHPDYREELYEIYKINLQQARYSFVELHGSAAERFNKAKAILNNMLSFKSVSQ